MIRARWRSAISRPGAAWQGCPTAAGHRSDLDMRCVVEQNLAPYKLSITSGTLAIRLQQPRICGAGHESRSGYCIKKYTLVISCRLILARCEALTSHRERTTTRNWNHVVAHFGVFRAKQWIARENTHASLRRARSSLSAQRQETPGE